MGAANMKILEAYVVKTDDGIDGRTCHTIGYATGNLEDIKRFYRPRATGYELYVEPIKVLVVTPDSAKEAQQLSVERKNLEARLDEINEVLGRNSR